MCGANYKSSSTSGYPHITSNPTVTINHLSILFNFLAGCPGLLNANGTISYVKLHVVLAGKCYPNHSASSAGFGSTLTLDYLNTLAEALSPSLLSSRTPQSFEEAVNITSEAAIRLRMPLVIRDSNIVFPEQVIREQNQNLHVTIKMPQIVTRNFNRPRNCHVLSSS